MLEWYKDKEIGIYFSEKPRVAVRYALPSMTKAQKTAINKYLYLSKLLKIAILIRHSVAASNVT